ncbi:MAG TPA: MBL fold metallo-hydrolase [Actinomycetes bacterium]|nr:MBL fold metallo-hydrolase [Actinomycetes bacterium]
MTYSGDVKVGGDAQVRELPKVIVSKLAVGPYENNVYLLRCRRTGSQLLIDAADEDRRIRDLIGPDGITGVVTTHRHPDHWQALNTIADRTGALTYAHRLDAPEIPVETDIILDDGDTVSVGEVDLHVIHLRGHTPGSIALVYDDPDGHPHVFTGDSLFPGGVGKSTPETFPQLIDDVEQRLFDKLPDETWVYPGHGADTTLGAERPQLGDWRERGW